MARALAQAPWPGELIRFTFKWDHDGGTKERRPCIVLWHDMAANETFVVPISHIRHEDSFQLNETLIARLGLSAPAWLCPTTINRFHWPHMVQEASGLTVGIRTWDKIWADIRLAAALNRNRLQVIDEDGSKAGITPPDAVPTLK